MTQEVTNRAAALAVEPMRPAGPRRGLVSGTLDSIKDLLAHRELLGMLVRRELKARYKDSTLGFVWSLLRPLAMLAIYYIALGQFLGAARGIPSFAIFIFAGLTAWGFFADTIAATTGSVVANSGLVKKVYLPREVFPLASVGSTLFNFAMQLIILLLGTVFVGQFPTGTRWGYAVLALGVLLVYATAIGLLMSALNVFLRDVQYLVEIAIMIFFWVSPVVYSWHFVQQAIIGTTLSEGVQSALLQAYLSNPVTLAVIGFQQTFWVAGDTPDPTMNFVPHLVPDLALRLGVTLIIGILFLWVAQRAFARLQANFAQEL